MITFLPKIFQSGVKSLLCISQLSMKRDLMVFKGDVCTHCPTAQSIMPVGKLLSIDFGGL